MRTRVAIIGAGPAGLLLGHLLERAGIDAVVLERRSREYVEHRVRAGVIEYGVANFLEESGVGDRMRREGLVHHGVELRFDRASHRVALSELYDGRAITVYGQAEVVNDLIKARVATGAPLLFETEVQSISGLLNSTVTIETQSPDGPLTIEADFVVGADGSHGVSVASIPASVVTRYERVYPFSWLGILAEAAPATEELIYCRHERGFALYSMRSPSVSRLYLGVDPNDSLENWSDERIWDELTIRLATDDVPAIQRGPIIERGITAMRSVVIAPMRYGRLLLAGDAAHIVPPTGAKGMNLALADIRVLAPALIAQLHEGDDRLLERYSDTCLERVWRAEEFSTYMTQMLHPYDHDPFESEVQRSRLAQAVGNPDVTRVLARNYVDLNCL
ncbi:MAG: 4-hydroxybenzoate 3-monooxygenase [Acidobacteriota bacterium]|nr:4-hydroxybenzoate 3-monooxygenase [Acidobacteriota bacterium]